MLSTIPLRALPAPLLAVALALGGSACTQPQPERRPDVVLVVIDTLRADRLSAYGYSRPTSPFLDRLAEEGVLFEDSTCQFSWTRPSMVSLFHGRYLTAYRDAMEPETPTLAEVFRGAGYRTIAAVANQILTRDGGFDRGFEHYDVGPTKRQPGAAEGEARDLPELAEDLWGPLQQALVPDASGKRPPIFLYLHPLDPHEPYTRHPDEDAVLPPDGAEPVLPEGWQSAELAELGPPPRTDPGGDRKPWDLELQQIQLERGYYDQGVRFTDASLRQVFARLREMGLLDNAVVAIVADHGEGLWEHLTPRPPEELRELVPWEFFYQRHGASQHQEVLATPFILWGRGVPAGLRIPRAVENVDLFPTLLELADVPAPEGLHGRSLVDTIHLRGGDWRPFVFSYGVHGTTVREVASGWKLIIPQGNTLKAGYGPRLFDLNADPHERTDLASEYPEVVERLVKAWREWRAVHPTEDNLSSAMSRHADRDERRTLKALGYTDLDIGGED